jgi:uncharacterized membrane protein
MRLAFSTAAIALAMLATGAATNPAAAADSNNAPWCVSAPRQGEFNCAYQSLTYCKEMATPTSGWCVRNPKWQ